jgi:hypothetical protein
MKKPRWVCRNKAERDYLVEWTKAKLDEQCDEPPLFTDDEIRVIERQASEQLAGGRRIAAIKRAVAKKNVAGLLQLIKDDPQLRDFAIKQFSPGSGRQKGQRRHPQNRSDIERMKLQEASADVERIRNLWMDELNNRNRSHRNPPTATAIAAGIWSVKEADLIKYRKN